MAGAASETDSRLGPDAVVLTKWSLLKRGYVAFFVALVLGIVLVPFAGMSVTASIWTVVIFVGVVTLVALLVQPVVWIDVADRRLVRGLFFGTVLWRWWRSEIAPPGEVVVLKKYDGPTRSKEGWNGGVRLASGRVYWWSYSRHRRFVIAELARLVPVEDAVV